MIEQKQCKFCEALERNKRANGIINYNQDPEERKSLGKYMTAYTVALVVHNWYKEHGKRTAGRSTDYRCRGLGYSLNYCPECGRKVQEVSNKSPKVDKESGELIRCKKCRYKERKGVDYFCDHITGEEIMVSPNDYCSWAEKED